MNNSKAMCGGKGERSQTKEDREKKVETEAKEKNRIYRIGVQKRATIDRNIELVAGRIKIYLILTSSVKFINLS